MIFAARQMQYKCQEQHQDLFMIFIDLTKALDSVHQGGLWTILEENWLSSEVHKHHLVLT
jgi:hypothetical protein